MPCSPLRSLQFPSSKRENGKKWTLDELDSRLVFECVGFRWFCVGLQKLYQDTLVLYASFDAKPLPQVQSAQVLEGSASPHEALATEKNFSTSLPKIGMLRK